MQINQKLIEEMNALVADATILYQRLRAFHWTVQGPQFHQLHGYFEEQYDHWADTIDDLAERVLIVGGTPPRTLAQVLERGGLDEESDQLSPRQMLERVYEDYGALHARMGSTLEAAEQAGDRGTTNLLDGIRDELEKSRWMLRAALSE
jgi:starvation-inducible DNA-binding protein